MKAFWRDGLRYPFVTMYPSQRFLKRVVKILPIHGVNAIGLKLPGLVGSSLAELLAINLIAADFHSLETMDFVQQILNMWTRIGIRAGHFLKVTYPILSKGEGADLDFILLITCMISDSENGVQSISVLGVRVMASTLAGHSSEDLNGIP